MDNKQKATIGGAVVVVGIIIWQVIAMFGGGSTQVASKQVAPPPMPTPKPAPVVEQQQPADPEASLEARVQAQNQARYVDLLNQNQMAKAQQEMSETNQKIAEAQEKIVEAQSKVLSMLAPPEVSKTSSPPTSTTQTVNAQGAPTGSQTAANQPERAVVTSAPSKEVKYGVVSVSKLENKWGAVISYASNLYSVHAGDVLPPDNSTVVSIDSEGVILEKDGIRTKVSMVSTI